MKNLIRSLVILSAVAVMTGSALAEVMDRPTGIKIGQRMTLRPYVSVMASYDSNIGSSNDNREDVIWTVNPGLSLDYKAETWDLVANVFYQYNAYSKSSNSGQSSYHGYGEDITYKWRDADAHSKGWSLMLTEKFQKINENESMNTADGSGYGRNRTQINVAAAIQRRFTDRLHGDINGSYYWLDYDNSGRNQGNSMFGWSRWMAGAEAGYAFSPWTDWIVAGSYSGYKQDNNKNTDRTRSNISSSSDSYQVQTGLGSWATERIRYRLLGGWSRFCYGGSNGKSSNGFVYTATSDWKISETWNTMLMATSYYQPSEREYSSSQRTDEISWGLAHSMVRNKLHATADVAYRRETHEYSADDSSKYDLNIIAFRLGLSYTLNRYLSFFGNAEYRKSMPGNGAGDGDRGDSYDYDRIRLGIGVRFTY